MQKYSSLRLTSLLIVLLFVSCTNENVLDPKEENPSKLITNSAPLLAKNGAVVQSVTGSGHFRTSGDNLLRTFSFNARKYADGSVSGQFQVFNRRLDKPIHGSITCFTIKGNQAWIGGILEKNATGEGGWRVVDNGEGSNARPDQISFGIGWQPPGFAQDYCNTTPDAPSLIDVERGNIQIHQK